MRIIAGAWRGRRLQAPPGEATRPTADRVRQALFDRLAHAPWAADLLHGARVLDAFAGTGAMGLEALSRGAAHATFLERNRAALAILRANIAACRAEAACRVLPCDALHPPPGTRCGLVFLDPPYRQDLPARAITALRHAGWIADGAVLLIETGRDDPAPSGEVLARFEAGAAAITAVKA